MEPIRESEVWAHLCHLPILHEFSIGGDGKIASRQRLVVPMTWLPSGFEVEGGHLAALGPFYFRRLEALSRGLIRVECTGPTIRFLVTGLRLPLLCFAPPETHAEPGGGEVAYCLVGGRALAPQAPPGGTLNLGMRQAADGVHVWMEVRDYYAWLVGWGRIWPPRRLLYRSTQAALHHHIARDFVRRAAHALLTGTLGSS